MSHPKLDVRDPRAWRTLRARGLDIEGRRDLLAHSLEVIAELQRQAARFADELEDDAVRLEADAVRLVRYEQHRNRERAA